MPFSFSLIPMPNVVRVTSVKHVHLATPAIKCLRPQRVVLQQIGFNSQIKRILL